jgi:peptidoglycan hydrolase CwlO-like protein
VHSLLTFVLLLLLLLLLLSSGDLSSARAQAALLSDVAAAGQALRDELEAELQDTQQQLAALTTQLTDSNTVRPGAQDIQGLALMPLGQCSAFCRGMSVVLM